MTDLDQQRVAAWIGDAFAILCVRVSRSSVAETRLRRGFESILRELGTSPLRLIARRSPLPPARRPITSGDLRHILSALDAAITVFDRYAGILTPAQHRVRELAVAARCHAAEELVAAPQRLAARACSRRRRIPSPRALVPLLTVATAADASEKTHDHDAPHLAATRELQPVHVGSCPSGGASVLAATTEPERETASLGAASHFSFNTALTG